MNENGAASQTPNRIIVHCMGEYITGEYAPDFITGLGLSAHAYITPAGEIIRQRHDNQGAWHAKGHNTNTLGVEILVPGNWTYGPWLEAIKTPWCNPIQFYSAAGLVRDWMNEWEIPLAGVVRHCDVDPERKADPGAGFDWGRFMALLAT